MNEIARLQEDSNPGSLGRESDVLTAEPPRPTRAEVDLWILTSVSPAVSTSADEPAACRSHASDAS